MDTEKQKKRVLIFSLIYYPRFIGGAEVAVKEITDRLGNDFDFDMITLRKQALKFERIGNVNVYRVGFGWRAGSNALLSRFKIYKYFFPFFAFFKALSLERRNHYDAVWSIMANYAGFGSLFFKLFYSKIPFILTLQEGDPISHIKRRVGVLYPLFKMIFTRADSIQAISYYLAGWAKEMGAKGPSVVIPNGVDFNRFKIPDSGFKNGAGEKIRQELGFGKEDILLVTTSRLVEKNAVGDIIGALTFLPDNVKLLIIGTGQLERSLKLKVEKLKLRERVHFIGFVPHEKLPPYLWASDIFIRPSLSEGMGNSFIEAMAAGLPVIATSVGGIVDFLKDGETGLFCEVGNPKSIAQKVEKLIKDSESRNYIVERASRVVKEKYDWNLVAERMKKEVFDVSIHV
ncbi:MAG: glycosyltransferase family 4 protein [bacterium]|nr:glycosyltransferase family 4 protein [bacterium]